MSFSLASSSYSWQYVLLSPGGIRLVLSSAKYLGPNLNLLLISLISVVASPCTSIIPQVILQTLEFVSSQHHLCLEREV